MMYWLIGAVVSGIVMWVGNNKAKEGVSWGKGVATAFGIVAIICAVVGLKIYLANSGSSMGRELSWQTIRGEKIGKWVAENYGDKKILILHQELPKGENGEEETDLYFEGVKKGLDKVEYKELIDPAVDQTIVEDTGGDWFAKHLSNLFNGKDRKGKEIPGASKVDDFDVLISTVGLPTGAFSGSACRVSELKGKKIALVIGYDEASLGGALKSGAIVVAAEDKEYPDDNNGKELKKWESEPPKDLDEAFNIRWELKESPKK